MKPPKCRLCAHEHFGADHVFAINKDAINASAINAEAVARVTAVLVESGAVASGPKKKSANRRDRAVYNEYMKKKMREYRAKKREAQKPS